MIIDLLRHGPKNNDPAAHQTGVEAQLDPRRIDEIRAHALRILQTADREKYGRLEVHTTPLDRSIATGKVTHEVFSTDRHFYVPPPRINALIGSSAFHPETGEPVNLSPRSMSTVLGEAKKQDTYNGQQGEHRPLYAWCEQGFDNKQAWSGRPTDSRLVTDPGISLREIAWRVGTYLHNTIENTDPATRVVAYGHSGDIEPWLYLTLDMHEGSGGASSVND